MSAGASPPGVRLVTMVEAARVEPGRTRVVTLVGHRFTVPAKTLESVLRPAAAPARLDAVLTQAGL